MKIQNYTGSGMDEHQVAQKCFQRNAGWISSLRIKLEEQAVTVLAYCRSIDISFSMTAFYRKGTVRRISVPATMWQEVFLLCAESFPVALDSIIHLFQNIIKS